MNCETIIDADGDIITTHAQGCNCPGRQTHPKTPTPLQATVTGYSPTPNGDIIITTQPYSIGKIVTYKR